MHEEWNTHGLPYRGLSAIKKEKAQRAMKRTETPPLAVLTADDDPVAYFDQLYNKGKDPTPPLLVEGYQEYYPLA